MKNLFGIVFAFVAISLVLPSFTAAQLNPDLETRGYLAVEFIDAYIAEHPDLSEQKKDVLTMYRWIIQQGRDKKLEAGPWIHSLHRILEREMRLAFSVEELIKLHENSPAAQWQQKN